MDSPLTRPPATGRLPDDTQLPESDGAVAENFQEHPQSVLLSGCLKPRLDQLHPDGQYAIGQNSGIYWRFTEPPLDGCKAPDRFYVPNVPPLIDGTFRRSYVMWYEPTPPLVVIEFVSGDGSEERDATPYRGKFWVYERAVGAPYYLIFDAERRTLAGHRLVGGHYEPIAQTAAGRLPVPPLGVEFGLWDGRFMNMELCWLRCWDVATGRLLPTTDERAETERRRAEAERKRADEAELVADDARRRLEEEVERAEAERRRADRLAERLRQLGMDPDAA